MNEPMSRKTVQFLAAVYPDRAGANATLASLRDLRQSGSITLADSVLVTRNLHGKIELKVISDGAFRDDGLPGDMVTGLSGIGLSRIPPGSNSIGETRTQVLQAAFSKYPPIGEIVENLAPGEAAVIVLVEDWVATIKAQRVLENVDGRLITEVFDVETIAEIHSHAATGD